MGPGEPGGCKAEEQSDEQQSDATASEGVCQSQVTCILVFPTKALGLWVLALSQRRAWPERRAAFQMAKPSLRSRRARTTFGHEHAEMVFSWIRGWLLKGISSENSWPRVSLHRGFVQICKLFQFTIPVGLGHTEWSKVGDGSAVTGKHKLFPRGRPSTQTTWVSQK